MFKAVSTTPLSINLDEYPGGVAAWGALPAVFDSYNQGFDRGVHLHARLTDPGKKQIDQSFAEVEVGWQDKRLLLTEESAVHFTLSSIFDFPILSLDCSHCGRELLDTGMAAVIPSFDHYCRYCGQLTQSEQRCAVNPILRFKQHLGDGQVKRPVIIPSRQIILDADRYPGGFQIWGSNPSILWTAQRQEESAIHVHAYDHQGKRIVDNTYGDVWVMGQLLDIEMVRVLQIQQALPSLQGYLKSYHCPRCNHPHFDQALLAVIPHQEHACDQCQTVFSTPRAISNPALALLKQLALATREVCHE
ncbi:hypothetical protein Lrub_2346 [Legionella rubrilucens]|uniref:Uncharacterized protein n=1 Tax=Legionella rubrilucens TaxID=458 RepID=A0A0W0XLJ8_9GAMM|nr:hypothetical protein [Legionella rubrilucens]KTD45549.1 hypothetical protein Lrub_2346 [Legionella rubrilucens]